MPKRCYKVRGNFPAQGIDLVEAEVLAGGWPAAIGLAARAMKKSEQLKGKKVKVASFTIEEVKVAKAAAAAPIQPQLAATKPSPEPANEPQQAEQTHPAIAPGSQD